MEDTYEITKNFNWLFIKSVLYMLLEIKPYCLVPSIAHLYIYMYFKYILTDGLLSNWSVEGVPSIYGQREKGGEVPVQLKLLEAILSVLHYHLHEKGTQSIYIYIYFKFIFDSYWDGSGRF